MVDAGESVQSMASAITAAVGGPEQAKSFADGAKHMLGEAQAGRWAVDEETGTHLRSAMVNVHKQLDGLRIRIDLPRQRPKLGNDAYAVQVAEHMRGAMDSDERSLFQVFLALLEGLDNLREALEVAVRNYDAADEAAVQRLGRFKDLGTRDTDIAHHRLCRERRGHDVSGRVCEHGGRISRTGTRTVVAERYDG